MKKRILSVILALAMLACMIPLGMVTVSAATVDGYVATVNGQGYFSIYEALEAAQEGEVLCLFEDIGELPMSLGANGYTIDLNGYKLQFPNGVDWDVAWNNEVDSPMMITDSSEDGTGTVEGDMFVGMDVSFVIQKGTYNDELVANGGSFIIYGGRFNDILSVEDGSITIYGGRFKYDPNEYAADGVTFALNKASGYYEVVHTHTPSDTYMTDGRAHWHACASEDCPLNKADNPVLEYEIAFSSYEGDALKIALDYSETCDSMLMGRQGKVSGGVVSNTDGRTIIGLTAEQLGKIGDKLVIVGCDDSDENKQVSVNVDCAYTWFYDMVDGEPVQIKAEDCGCAAFVIFSSEDVDGDITGFGYYRVYNDDGTLIGEALYAAPRTFKAVYDTTNDANTFNFYFDTIDHSGANKTVYENTAENPTGLFEVQLQPNKALKKVIWGYESIKGNVKGVAIDPTVIKYKGLEYTKEMFKGMLIAVSIDGAQYLDVTNVKHMGSMFEDIACDRLTYSETGAVTDIDQVPDVSRWNTANVTSFDQMFLGYGGTSTVLNEVPDVSHWNTAKATSFLGMFAGYGHLSAVLDKVPDVSHWKTDNVTKLGAMFYQYACESTVINAVPDVSDWNTANVKTVTATLNGVGIVGMFEQYAYTSEKMDSTLDLSNWNFSSINDSNSAIMFVDSCASAADGKWNVIIPAMTGEQSNDSTHWYVGDGTDESKYIAPASGREFTVKAN